MALIRTDKDNVQNHKNLIHKETFRTTTLYIREGEGSPLTV